MGEEQKYTIIRKLDTGGMAEVFIADSEAMKGFKKRVAIKRILPHLTKNQKFVQMFLDEARLSLQLEHANIVSVFDIGRADASFFIVMEYVDGTNLKKMLESHKRAGKPIPLAQAIYIMREVCEGLSYAHDQRDIETDDHLGIVHRDISPPNILLSQRGEIKLVDFGLAKATSQLESTDPGVVKGKFSYLSPEMASGQEVDARADLFAVGILLFEMLANQRLFYGENDYHTVELVRKAEVPPVTNINPNVPPEMEEILRKALSKDRDQRYQHANELSQDLTKLLFGHGLAVSRQDISGLVKFTVEEQKTQAPAVPKRPSTIIDALIQEEILKFTSLEKDEPLDLGAKPLSPDEISVLDPGDFIDPRGWASDLDDTAAAELSAPEIITDRPPHTDEISEDSQVVALPGKGETEKDGAARAAHRQSSPGRKDAEKGMPAVVWVLLVVAALAATAAVLVVLDIVKI